MVHMTVPEPEGSADALARLLRLQSDFVARLSEETVRYLRGLQGIVGPAAPGTIVVPRADEVLEVEGTPGDNVRICVEVTNDQQAHCAVAPSLSPLVAETGATWFPDVVATPAYALIAPQDTQTLAVEIAIPAELPPGDYRGAILIRAGSNGAGILAHVLPLHGNAGQGSARPQARMRPR